jgi:hypothetical protein
MPGRSAGFHGGIEVSILGSLGPRLLVDDTLRFWRARIVYRRRIRNLVRTSSRTRRLLHRRFALLARRLRVGVGAPPWILVIGWPEIQSVFRFP